MYDINDKKIGKIIRVEESQGENPEEKHHYLVIRVRKFPFRNLLFPLHEKYIEKFHTIEKKISLNFTKKYFLQLVDNYLIQRKFQASKTEDAVDNLSEAQARSYKV